jgi:deoxyribodipyrimidine photo-lyase
MHKYENGIFLFHRDLRIQDNIGLIQTIKNCKHIYPVFIFTPEQVGSSNPYKSNNAVQFMIESLEDLNDEIHKYSSHSNTKLNVFYGNTNKVIKECIDKWNIEYICFNKDYTPYAIERDNKLCELCEKMKVVCEMASDYYVYEPGTIKNVSGNPYQKFTPYYNTVKTIHPPNPKYIHNKVSFVSRNIQNHSISLHDAFSKFTKMNIHILSHGGRNNGLDVLKTALKTQKEYSKTRDFLSIHTTLLSPYIKFGCVSIREVFHKFRYIKELIRQLIWREFYMNILFSFPYVLGHAMKPSYNKIRWHKNNKYLHAWKTGTTGFPIVDAGMRQLNTTGYMHNRARLIVASFLTKTLLIDWREGEQYFSQKLVDYDPASNNGNWQWIASTGADSQPYFRIFNPFHQSEQVDEDAVYIKTWIPELKDIPAKELHNWDKYHSNYNGKNNTTKVNYPAPIVNYSVQKEKALEMYNVHS